jgi:hypothetical protein
MISKVEIPLGDQQVLTEWFSGLPVHLPLTPGEAHDNRLCSVSQARINPHWLRANESAP